MSKAELLSSTWRRALGRVCLNARKLTRERAAVVAMRIGREANWLLAVESGESPCIDDYIHAAYALDMEFGQVVEAATFEVDAVKCRVDVERAKSA